MTSLPACPMTAEAGQWDLVIDLYQGEERAFRSRNRITLPRGH